MGQKLPEDQLALYRRLDEVLFYVWDPIGISTTVWSRDEYQSYLPQVFKMLLNDSSDKVIVDYLMEIECNHMGLGRQIGTKKRTVEFVSLIRKLKKELLDGES